MTNSRSDLMFIVPSLFYIEEYQKIMEYNDLPVNVLQISSLLRERLNIKIGIIDLRMEEERYNGLSVESPKFENFQKNLVDVLENNNIQEFDNLCLFIDSSYQYLQSQFIARFLKENFPHKNIIAAGSHPTTVPNDFNCTISPYDIIITGEMEYPFLDLFKSNLLNLTQKRNKYVHIKSSELFPINALPFPDYNIYMTKYPFKNKFSFEVSMSKGCPFNCAFCPCERKLRNYSFETFKENFNRTVDIAEQYNNQKSKIIFSDRSFNSAEISSKVLDYLIKNEFSTKFKFSCQTRIETVSKHPNLINLFHKAQMVVGFGLESINPNLLKDMNKTTNPKSYIDHMKTIIELTKNFTNSYFRINILVGFPGETKETFNQTTEFINKYALRDNIQISPTIYSNFPNTFIYNNMTKYEVKYGAEFLKEWWKIPSNPLKNSILVKSSTNYSKVDFLKDYIENYTEILKTFKEAPYYSLPYLIIWRKFFLKWLKELVSS